MIWGYCHFRKPQVDPFDTLVVLVVPCSCSDSLLDALRKGTWAIQQSGSMTQHHSAALWMIPGKKHADMSSDRP